MNTDKLRLSTSISFSLALTVLTVLLATAQASAQCTQVISGLRGPLGTALSNQGNLLVSETGTSAQNSGRISILDASGNRRTLLDGLPSAINDVSEPSGPAGHARPNPICCYRSGRRRAARPGSGDHDTKPRWAFVADF